MSVNNMPAYTISNENQRWATQVIPNVQSVLTVAGSGDQALFYKLAGAKIIDTFDITCNARVIQDVKYAAIKCVDVSEYKTLLTKSYHADGSLLMSLFAGLWNFLPEETREIIENNRNTMIFGCGLSAESYPENIPTDTEYAQLRKVLNRPFNFIWSDVDSLSTKLTKKYDLINLSNIFDYIPSAQTQIKILNDLSEHLNINGRIVLLPQVQRFNYKNLNLPHLTYEKTETKDLTKMVLLQRTR